MRKLSIKVGIGTKYPQTKEQSQASEIENGEELDIWYTYSLKRW